MLSHNWHRNIFLFGLIGLAAGMLFGTVPTSIPQIILAANWLLEKNFRWKWDQLKTNTFFWVLVSFFLLHVIGMAYTDNIPKGLDDLRNKIPLLVLPLILFSTKALSAKEFKLLFTFFFVSVFVSSVCCFMVHLGFTKKVIVDVRQSSIFMSHIRFSLFIAFSIIGLIYFAIKDQQNVFKSFSVLVIVWLLFFMYRLEMATGFLCLIIVGSSLLLLYGIRVLKPAISFSLIILFVIGGVFVAHKAIQSLNMFYKSNDPTANIVLEKSINGNPYLNDTLYGLAENGNLIGLNIRDSELAQEWPKRSHISYSDKDKKGNDLRYTLLHYMASKGLTKDSLGLSKLTDVDIQNVEMGVSNYKYTNQSGLIVRWRELVWEYTQYKLGENPSGHTLTMRLEFWKTACFIISKYPIIGVGTGDVQDAFNKAYIETNSKLNNDWRLRCHNQYLAITVAFGIIGLVVFLFYLFYPAINLRKKIHYLYWPFFLIVLLSFITEDTLETQSGVTFFMFFNALFLWLASLQKEKTKHVA
jgi:hypothetical protein